MGLKPSAYTIARRSSQHTTEQGIEFSLFAPYNETVVLVGDWNNWQPIDMLRGDDGWWSVNVPLKDGDYAYKFEVKSKSYFAEGETKRIADPYAPFLSRDSDENSCIIVKGGKPVVTTYEWQHDDVPLPNNQHLVIYEMHVSDFSGGPGDVKEGQAGTFQDVIDKLDYLVSLGVNAIELMPVNEWPGEYSWGYNLRSIFAVENNYGTPDDFCHLVDECHGRGIRVILDGVYNHSDKDAPLAQIDYTYWYHREDPNPPEMRFGPKFNYDFHDDQLDVWPARQYVRDAILFWIDHFHLDGIRFDATAAIDNYEFLHWIKTEIFNYIKDIKPFFTIAEHVPQDTTVAGPEGPLDAAWHETFSKQMMSTLTAKEKEGRQPFNLEGIAAVLNPRIEGFASPFNVVNYIDNHDQTRILWQLGEAAILDEPAFRRVKMGATLLMTAPGTPMIWMGQEFGESAAKTQDRQPIDWSLLQNQTNSDLRNFYAGLIRLRTHTEALNSDTVEIIHADPERSIIAYKRWDSSGGVVVVVANLRDQFAGDIHIANWPGDGKWHEYTDNYDTEVQGGVLNDKLAESEVKVFIKV